MGRYVNTFDAADHAAISTDPSKFRRGYRYSVAVGTKQRVAAGAILASPLSQCGVRSAQPAGKHLHHLEREEGVVIDEVEEPAPVDRR